MINVLWKPQRQPFHLFSRVEQHSLLGRDPQHTLVAGTHREPDRHILTGRRLDLAVDAVEPTAESALPLILEGGRGTISAQERMDEQARGLPLVHFTLGGRGSRDKLT